MIGLLVICFTEVTASIMAAISNNLHFLRAIIVLNMVLITLFAPVLIEFGNVTTNLGSIFYTTAMLIQGYIVLHFGKKEAVNTINKILFVLFTLSGICYGINLLHPVIGNESFFSIVSEITHQSVLALFASLFAFVSGQLVLIEAWERSRFNKKVALIFAILLAQLVDSVMFFGIAFHDSPNLWELMFVGFSAKAVLTLIASPLLFINKYD